MKFTLIETAWGDQDVGVSVTRSEKFYENAQALSDYIAALNLPSAKNNRLVELIIEQICEAEHTAFLDGAKLGIDATKWAMENGSDQDDEQETSRPPPGEQQ